MISLKDAFRLLNHFESTITALSAYIKDINNAVKVVEEHNRKVANPDAENETIDVTAEHTYPNASIVDILYLVKKIVNEKVKLSLAIENAKRNIEIKCVDFDTSLTLDSSVELAKQYRKLAVGDKSDYRNNKGLKDLVNIKASETTKSGKSFKINVEGNQTGYVYDVKVITTIDFNRDVVNDNYKKLLDIADKLSTQIENAMSTECVVFDSDYSIYDSVEDIVNNYIANK